MPLYTEAQQRVYANLFYLERARGQQKLDVHSHNRNPINPDLNKEIHACFDGMAVQDVLVYIGGNDFYQHTPQGDAIVNYLIAHYRELNSVEEMKADQVKLDMLVWHVEEALCNFEVGHANMVLQRGTEEAAKACGWGPIDVTEGESYNEERYAQKLAAKAERIAQQKEAEETVHTQVDAFDDIPLPPYAPKQTAEVGVQTEVPLPPYSRTIEQATLPAFSTAVIKEIRDELSPKYQRIVD
jgi:hypothetical protein